MSTQSFPAQPENRTWYVVDAGEYPLGRLASRVAIILRGKHKPIYSPHVDHGDHVVVINAALVQLTGKKREKKTYFRYTGYMGGAKIKTLEEMMIKTPEEVIRHAVRGMLPKTRLGRQMIKKLKIYRGSEHPHEAQNPKAVTLADTSEALETVG
jgi:large subunit ribosomal protein L13